jgi:hypothetical protein
MATHQFEIEGIRFELKHLSVDDSCAGLETLAKTLGPAIESFDGVKAKALIVKIAAQAGSLAVLLKLFAPAAKVSRNADGTFAGGDLMLPLKTEANAVFAGRVDLLVAFLFEAIQFEYGAFLGALVANAAEEPTNPA